MDGKVARHRSCFQSCIEKNLRNGITISREDLEKCKSYLECGAQVEKKLYKRLRNNRFFLFKMAENEENVICTLAKAVSFLSWLIDHLFICPGWNFKNVPCRISYSQRSFCFLNKFNHVLKPLKCRIFIFEWRCLHSRLERVRGGREGKKLGIILCLWVENKL